jgi:hypothetical protein
LRELDLTALHEEGFRPTGADADIFTAQQAGGLDAGVAVVGDLLVLVLDAQQRFGLEVLGVESD